MKYLHVMSPTMANFLPKSAPAFLLTAFGLLSLIMLLLQSSDCCVGSAGSVSSMKISAGGMHQQHRKLLASSENNETVFQNGVAAPATRGEGKNTDDWELRTAPLGPDPLHHHGGSPKPRITP